MKTLVKIATNVSWHSFANTETIVMKDDCVEVGDPVNHIITHCDKNNSILYENIIFPNEWKSGKFKYDGQTWTLNPDYIE